MALTDAEVARIKAELGYNLLDVGATAYIGVTQLFEQVIQVYLDAGTSTTSATSVTAASSPTPVNLTLTSATGFSSGARVVIDVDSRKETVTIQNLSGTSMTVQLRLAHSGTYPVALADSGEGIVRELLGAISLVREQRAKSGGRGALKEVVGDVGWYDTKKSAFDSSHHELDMLRDELAAHLGVANMWRVMARSGQTMSVY